VVHSYQMKLAGMYFQVRHRLLNVYVGHKRIRVEFR
jgi:hypothetical protein